MAEGVITVPVSCSCFKSPSVFASYARLPVKISNRIKPSA